MAGGFDKCPSRGRVQLTTGSPQVGEPPAGVRTSPMH